MLAYINSIIGHRFSQLGNSSKVLLFTHIAEYEAGGLDLLTALEDLVDSTDNGRLIEVAQLCISSIHVGQPFAHKAHEAGYFTDEEAALLDIGEQYQQIGKVSKILVERMVSGGTGIGTMLAKKTELVISAVLMTSILVVMLPKKIYAEVPIAVTVSEFLFDHAFVFIVAAITGVVFYRLLARKLTGEMRYALADQGFFVSHDWMSEYTFLRIGGELCKAQVEPEQIYETNIDAMIDNEFFREKLIRGQRALQTEPFVRGFKMVVRPESFTRIRAKSPNGAITEIGEGCDMAAKKLLDDINARKDRITLALEVGLYAWLLFVMIPLIFISSGVGVSAF